MKNDLMLRGLVFTRLVILVTIAASLSGCSEFPNTTLQRTQRRHLPERNRLTSATREPLNPLAPVRLTPQQQAQQRAQEARIIRNRTYDDEDLWWSNNAYLYGGLGGRRVPSRY